MSGAGHALIVRQDTLEIEQAVYRYATALDTRDWRLLASVLAPDIVFVPDGFDPLLGFEAIRDVVSAALEGQISQHYLTNVAVSLDGDTARCSSYLQAQHIRAGTPGGDTLMVAGVYRDDLRRRAGAWQFTRRVLNVQWMRGNPAVPLGKVAGS